LSSLARWFPDRVVGLDLELVPTVSRSSVSFFLAFAAICVAGSVSATTRAQEPTLDRVLFRAGEYVANLQQQLRGIVAEETSRNRWSAFACPSQ
jgi:hypothetical protein